MPPRVGISSFTPFFPAGFFFFFSQTVGKKVLFYFILFTFFLLPTSSHRCGPETKVERGEGEEEMGRGMRETETERKKTVEKRTLACLCV